MDAFISFDSYCWADPMKDILSALIFAAPTTPIRLVSIG